MKGRLLHFYIAVLKSFGVKVINFIHVGKTAGSAIRRVIYEGSTLSGNLYLKNGYLIKSHGHNFTFMDCPDNEFVFFVVRDPVERFISAFYSRLREGKPKNYNPWNANERIAFSHFDHPNDLAESLSNPDKEIRSKAEFAMKSIGHVNSSYWDWFESLAYLESNLDKIKFVLQQESLEADFNRFRKAFSLELRNLPSDPIKSHKTPEHLNKRISQLSKSNIKKWYAKDYEFLNYLYQKGIIQNSYI